MGWIGFRAFQGGVASSIREQLVGPGGLSHIAIGVSIYAVGVAVLASAWYGLIRGLSSAHIPWQPSLSSYLSSQFAKYLPGNVAQYAGRHMLFRRLGVSHRALAWCAVGEAGLLLLAASAWAGTVAVRWWPWLSPERVALLAAVGLAVVGPGLWIVWRRTSWLEHLDLRWLLLALLQYVLFFGLMGTALAVIARNPGISYAFDLVGVAALSWAAGFLAVGAPAGVGVREAVFTLLLADKLGEPGALALATAFRLVTFGGDAVAFLAGAAMATPWRRDHSHR